jgi:hypothetical protein
MINRIPNNPLETNVGVEKQNSSSLPIPNIDLSVVQEWRRDVEDLIAKHPGTFLAVSVGVGLVLGWWAKRK